MKWFPEDYQTYVVDNVERNSIVSRLARYCVRQKDKYVIILVSRIAHLKALSQRLEDIPHRLVYGEKDVSERKKYTKKFEKGRVRLIIASSVFKKGVNIKRVDVIIDACGQKSKNDAIQKFGRGVRTHSDKDGLLYFDLSDIDPKPSTVVKKRKIKGKQVERLVKVHHNLHMAGVSRKNAYLRANIPVMRYEWDDDGSIKTLYKQAEQFLKQTSAKRRTHVSQ